MTTSQALKNMTGQDTRKKAEFKSTCTPDNTRIPKNPTLVQDCLDDGLSDERREWKAPERWHASGLGSCLVSRYLARQGMRPEEHDERTLRVFSMGNLTEEHLLKRLKKKLKLKTQEYMYLPEWDLSGYCDVMVTGKKKGVECDDNIIEIKSCRSDDFWRIGDKYPPKLQHRLQTWAYLWGFDMKVGRLVYISKDDQAIKEFAVHRDERVLECIVKNELLILNEAMRQNLPPPPIRFDDKGEIHELMSTDWQYRYSPYSKIIKRQEKYLDINDLILLKP